MNTRTYNKALLVITYDITFDRESKWTNAFIAFNLEERNKANKRWLELKKDPRVSNIRTSQEIIEQEISTCSTVIEAFETGQISAAEARALYNEFVARDELVATCRRCWKTYDSAMKHYGDAELDDDYFVAEAALKELGYEYDYHHDLVLYA